MAIEQNQEPLDPDYEEPRKRGAFPSVKVTMTRAEIIAALKKNRRLYISFAVVILFLIVLAGCAIIGAVHTTANARQNTPPVATAERAEQQQRDEAQWQQREKMMAQGAGTSLGQVQYANGQQVSPELRQRILDCENGTGSCAGIPAQYLPNGCCQAAVQSQGSGMSPEQQAAQADRQRREEFAWKARFAGPNDGPLSEKRQAAATEVADQPQEKQVSMNDKDEPETSAKQDDFTGEEKKAPYSSSSGHEYRLMGGITQIPCRIENGITAELDGSVLAFVTDDVWSWHHQEIVIPKGSLITGKYRKVGSNTEERVQVLLESIVMPDGYRVNFADANGLDLKGETGLRDKVNHHYVQVFATSIGIAAVGGIAQLGNTTSGFTYSPESIMRQGFAGGMGQAGEQALSRYSNRRPTLTIRPGTVLNLYFPHDMLLPAYSAHTMAPNL